MELRGDREVPFQYYQLLPGDYQARLLNDSHKMGNTPLFQVYEVVFPDKTVGVSPFRVSLNSDSSLLF